MAGKRKIEVFSAGCRVCEGAVRRIREIACESCEVEVLDMHNEEVPERADELGIRSIPIVVINGQLVDCCSGRGIDEDVLRSAGLGQPVV